MRHLPVTLLSLLLSATPVLSDTMGCDPVTVRILSPEGAERSRYTVRVADDPVERERGLMFVEELPKNEGMLFVFGSPSEVGFWMRNTLIPLDLIFIEETGRVGRVHRDAIPHDETPIWSGGPVTWVLEVNAGETDLTGIAEGDLVAPGCGS